MPPLTQTATSEAPLSVTSTGSFLQTRTGRASLGIAATLLVALCAQISVPLPFTPVPFTLQTFAVLLVGFLLGPVAGFCSLLGYLAEGAAGLPVFSLHGVGGIAQLMGPTGGYLLAYPFVAAIAGYLSRALRRSVVAYAVAGTAATVFVFLCGAAWLMAGWHLGAHAVWIAAIAPFLPGEVIKICAAAGIARALDRHPNK